MEQTKILVVDDDRRMVKTICDILTINGFSVESALTGDEAVAKVETLELDCVLMDLKMPGLTGVEALKLIKAHKPDLPVVMMSAYATEEQVEEARRLGAYSILTKPVDIQLILSFFSLLRKEDSILVVDDDPAFCRTLGEILESRGYRVETEHDAGRVLGHMDTVYQLLVILDIKLGQADGVGVLREIRDRYPTKPVVLVTGNRHDVGDSIEQGRQVGAYTCLYKPFEIDGLIGLIKEIKSKKLRALLGETFR
jgi:DNA-binding NtrC family response regulator